MIITCHKSNLEARCYGRGYSLEEVMPCVVSIDNDQWTIDTENPSYPKTPKPGYDSSSIPTGAKETPAEGVGTELKKLLSRIGITSTAGCSCNARASLMNENGIEWCEANIDQIVSWLREEATNRGLPFFDIAGKMIVKLAIKRAKKNIK